MASPMGYEPGAPQRFEWEPTTRDVYERIRRIEAAIVPTHQIFKIPNNWQGRLWLMFARRWKMPKTTIVVRNRTPRKGAKYHGNGDLYRDEARQLGIYVNR